METTQQHDDRRNTDSSHLYNIDLLRTARHGAQSSNHCKHQLSLKRSTPVHDYYTTISRIAELMYIGSVLCVWKCESAISLQQITRTTFFAIIYYNYVNNNK